MNPLEKTFERRSADRRSKNPEARDRRLRQPTPEIVTQKMRPELRLVHNVPVIKPAQEEVSAELDITVSNIQVSRGRIMLGIYDSKESFNRKMRHVENLQARKGEMTFRFPNLPTGEYAVMVFQDLNESGKLGTDLLGRPTEPWGASMRDKPSFRAPTWSDVCFSLTEDGLSLTIELQ
ncbi:MAG: DUF2141 domain-containing protein [Granulosicoccus sp.]